MKGEMILVIAEKNINNIIKDIVEKTHVTDIHTHLFAPQFGIL